MADGEVKIHISADLDSKGYDEEERRRKKLKEDEGKGSKATPTTPPPEPKPPAQPTPKPQPTAPAPTAKPEGAAKEDWSRSQLATEANPRTAPRREFRKLTDEERAANRARIEAEDQAAKDQRNAPQIAEKEAARTAKERVASDRALAKERAATEKAITREAKEQEAMRKAGIHRVGAVAAVGQNIAQGQSPVDAGMSGLMNLGASGGIVGMIAATVAAASVGVVGMLSKQADDTKMRMMGVEERDANARYRIGRQAGIHGSSSALVSTSLDAQEEVAARKEARAALAEKARVKWYDPSTWTFGGVRKNEGQKEQEVNEAESAAATVRMVEAKKAAEKKYMGEEGGLELDALRGRSSRSLEGSRAAMTSEMSAQALAKYKESKNAGATDEVAKEMGTLTYQNELRDRMATGGAGMVDSRSGGAEMAAAARWASGVNPAEKDIAAKFDTLIATVNQGNQGAQIVKHEK